MLHGEPHRLRFEYESRNDDVRWWRSHGNELWEFDEEGYMRHRDASINDLFMAGQVAWDADGRTVGENDLAAQVEQCYLNVATALAGVGGTFEDMVKLTIYVPDWTHDKYPPLEEGISRASAKLWVTPVAPVSLIGIAALFTPDLMVEVEAIAVMD